MIGRLWRTRVEPARLAEYERFAAEVSLPMFRRQPGFRGVVMLRDGGDCLVLTLWADRAAVDALARSPSYRETVERITATGFLLGEQTLETYHAHLVALPDEGRGARPEMREA